MLLLLLIEALGDNPVESTLAPSSTDSPGFERSFLNMHPGVTADFTFDDATVTAKWKNYCQDEEARVLFIVVEAKY